MSDALSNGRFREVARNRKLCSRCESIRLDNLILQSLASTITDPEGIGQVMFDDDNESSGRYITTLTGFLGCDSGQCALCQLLLTKLQQRDPEWSPLENAVATLNERTCILVLNDTINCQPWYSYSLSVFSGTINELDPDAPLKADILISVDQASAQDLPTIAAKRLTPSVNLSLLIDWIDTCESRHERCIRDSTTVLHQFRISLIDCERRQVVSGLLSSKYIALSYVWGGVTLPCINEHGLLPRTLPDLVEDSMAVALGCGLKYLWIDQYCILQVDPEDMHTQLSRMGDIFSCAVATIVALGESPHIGLPGVRSSVRATSLSADLGSVELFLPKHEDAWRPWNRQWIRRESCWAQRGWCYQEGSLSRRIVCFTENDMHFECAQGSCLESITHLSRLGGVYSPDGLAERFRLSDISESPTIVRSTKFGTIEDLNSEIMWYSRRRLTFQADGLNAFYGTLNAYRRASVRLYHHWGTPFISSGSLADLCQSFLVSLCWHFTGTKQVAENRRSCFPSWSWVGWNMSYPQWYSWSTCRKDSDLMPYVWINRKTTEEGQKGFVPLSWLRDHDEFAPARFGHQIRFCAYAVAFCWVMCDNLDCDPFGGRFPQPHYHPVFDRRSECGAGSEPTRKTFSSNGVTLYDDQLPHKQSHWQWKLLRLGATSPDQCGSQTDMIV